MSKLLVHTSPHLRGPDSTHKIMWSVVAAMFPALLVSGYFFGPRAYLITAVAIIAAVVTEAAIELVFKRPVTISDGSAAVTGLLVGFCLPPHCSLYVPVVGAFVAIAIAKHCFGGLGYNIWNPALIGRAFVYFSFPTNVIPSEYPLATADPLVDAVSGASPLAVLKDGAVGNMPDLWDCFIGNIRGNIGETSALLLLVGVAYLIYRGYVRWPVPVLYLGTVAVLSLVLPSKILVSAPGPAGEAAYEWQSALAALGLENGLRLVGYHLFCGGLMLGALFMATDMVTSPMTTKGQIIFGLGAGLLTIVIRMYGGMPEGVCFSILLMNTATPLIDRWTQARIFGTNRKQEGNAEK